MRAVCQRQASAWDAIERMAFRPLTAFTPALLAKAFPKAFRGEL